jgi:integrase/recombinase XerC
LAALRSVVELARDAGVVDWSLNVKGLRARAYRDTAGPCRADVAAVLAAADSHPDRVKATRDGALLRLLYGLALRRSEAVGLDLGHVDLDAGVVFVRGKGKHDREPMTIPGPTRRALARWLDIHPNPRSDAPLFPTLDRVSRGKRLSDRSVSRVLKVHCRAAGVRECAPHGLRHAAITAALDATNGDVRKVRAFSRHAKLETVAIYDDKRTDGAAEVAALVAM